LGDDPYDVEKFAGVGGFTISGGNFHGEYPAKALDMLCMTIHELSSISEVELSFTFHSYFHNCTIEKNRKNGEPQSKQELGSISDQRRRSFFILISNSHLFSNKGLNSGFMMAHVTAAALVSENKVLCHPSSVDSIPTSAGQEDHVSMGGRKKKNTFAA